MSEKIPTAGGHILSRCSKCKETTNHTIVAMVGSRVARVECNVCGSVHNHRGTTAPKVRSDSTRTPAQPRKSRARAQWETLVAEADDAAVTPYNMKTPVKTGDLISHPSFGIGKVISTTKPNKMEVAFADGVKLLRCTVAG
jgi:CxxC motif-containing protein